MCGRYSLLASASDLIQHFGLVGDLFLPSKPEFAPTTEAPIIRSSESGRIASIAKWGLVPGWSKDTKIASATFNARCETLAEKPAFRSAFKRKRCLVPATCFYEWREVPGQKRKEKLAIALADSRLMALAGLWETATIGGNLLETFTVVTCAPNPAMAAIHNRMPVILSEGDWGLWLGAETKPDLLRQIMQPYSGELLIEPA